MQMPKMLQGDGLMTHGSALAAGIVIALILVFKVAGCYTPSQAADQASAAAIAATATALTPVCEDLFRKDATAAQWAEFKKKDSYNRSDVVKAVVKMPDPNSFDNYTLLEGCTDQLAKPPAKSAMK